MKKNQWICLGLLAAFVMAVIGCGDSNKNVIQPQQKIGLTAEERKSKRGE